MAYTVERPIETLKGLTFASVSKMEDERGLAFRGSSDGAVYDLSHRQECCEDVIVEDVCGDLADLVDSPILGAYVASSEKKDSGCMHETWTFIKIHTAKGFVTVRFHGSSNGYYGEDAQLLRVYGSYDEADLG